MASRPFNESCTALILSSGRNRGWSDYEHYEEMLYRTKAGVYFLHGEGGARTRYAAMARLNSWCVGQKIVPMAEEDAKAWVEKHLEAGTYENAFGGMGEDEPTTVTSYLPKSVLAALDAKKAEMGGSRSDVILAALGKYL